jgi:hypothetical protein
MSIGLILLAIVGLGVLGVFVATKFFGAFKDEDNDGIPDKLEEKIEESKEVVSEIKERAQKVSAEAKDVVKAVKEVVKQSKDVVTVATTKTTARRGRKPKQK